MEYVCKVGTPAGDVVEQTFTAPDEASLRADLEQQGYYLFGAVPYVLTLVILVISCRPGKVAQGSPGELSSAR